MSTLAPDRPVLSLDDLAAVLAPGDGYAFTRQLLGLVAVGGRENRARLARLYPREVAAWRWWCDGADGELTASMLRARLERLDGALHSVSI